MTPKIEKELKEALDLVAMWLSHDDLENELNVRYNNMRISTIKVTTVDRFSSDMDDLKRRSLQAEDQTGCGFVSPTPKERKALLKAFQ
jgi:hypothetical protein